MLSIRPHTRNQIHSTQWQNSLNIHTTRAYNTSMLSMRAYTQTYTAHNGETG